MTKEEAFTNMIKKNEGVIFKITSIYASGQYNRQDLYQEIVYQLWKSFDSFRQESKRGTWLYRVALNTAITQNRRSKKRGHEVPIDQTIMRKVDSKDTLLEERLKELYTQIEKLNVLEKGVILLYLEGKSYEEIAEIMGLSTSNVGTKLSRIREKLKSMIVKSMP